MLLLSGERRLADTGESFEIHIRVVEHVRFMDVLYGKNMAGSHFLGFLCLLKNRLMGRLSKLDKSVSELSMALKEMVGDESGDGYGDGEGQERRNEDA